MSKAIEPIPTLRGEDARIFIEDIMHPEKITKLERNFIEEVKKTKLAIK